MQTFELLIITETKKLKYIVEQPETDEEHARGLADRNKLPAKHGMIYFKRSVYHDLSVWTPQTKIPVDFIFINFAGDVVKIVHNAKPLSKKIYRHINVSAVLEINGGECKKLGIHKGDTVVHPDLNLSSENQYNFHSFKFNKLTSRTFVSKINKNKVAFAATASGGAMGWAGASQFFTKDGKKYMLTAECIESTETIDAFFETLHKPEWRSCNLGVGNHLYIKSEYYQQFIEEKERLNLDKPNKVYRDWCKIADEILSKKIFEKIAYPKTHLNNILFVKFYKNFLKL